MAELLVRAQSTTLPDPIKDQRAAWKQGYPVIAMEDKHLWGREEHLPKFVILKLPGVPVEIVQKYVDSWKEPEDGTPTGGRKIRVRRWRIRWEDLPTAAMEKLMGGGELVIQAKEYTGEYDYTWAQIKGFFHNMETGLDETEDL